jgi:hypothetical protein
MSRPIARDPIYRRRRFEAETIELCVRWYISYRLSYRDLVAMMGERGSRETLHPLWTEGTKQQRVGGTSGPPLKMNITGRLAGSFTFFAVYAMVKALHAG